MERSNILLAAPRYDGLQECFRYIESMGCA